METLIDITTILKQKVSYQKDTWAKLTKEVSIQEIFDDIKGDVYKKAIERLRMFQSEGDLESYKAEKLKLPAVTFCATFDEVRRKDNLKTYNNLIVIDIDKLTEEELLLTTKNCSDDKYVLAFWISPSNKGIKGLVSLDYSFELSNIDECHKCAFEKLHKYFYDRYNIRLDTSGSDTTRLCFLSWDTNLYINSNAYKFLINQSDIHISEDSERVTKQKIRIYNTNKKNALYNPNGKNRNFEKREIKDIINFLTKKKIVITGEYENRYKIAYSIANSFTYDIGVRYFLDLCKIEIEKYNKGKEIKLLEYCYENNTGWTKFIFIEELAKNNGYVKKTLEKVVS